MRQAGARDDGQPRQQPLQDAAHGRRAQKQRFLAPAQVEKSVGEHVAAFKVARQLHLVDGDELGIGFPRHRFHGAHRVAGAGRADLFLAGDQCHVAAADPHADALVDLAGEQPQRQADHAAAMRHHAFDRVMGLAGVGRAEHGGHAAARIHLGRSGMDWGSLHQAGYIFALGRRF